MAEQATSVGMQRKLAAIFSTDVAGYSRLMGDDEEATIHTLTAYRSVISSLIQQYRGRVVDSPGDNLLAEFASVVDAVRCAVEIQYELKGKNTELPEHRQMRFRIGINLGDVIVEGERLYGDGVNIAARMESLAVPGGLCIAGAVYEQVKNKLALSYEDLGEQVVKNIADPVRVYRVITEPTAADSANQKAENSVSQNSEEQPQPRRGSISRRFWLRGLLAVFMVGLGVLVVTQWPLLVLLWQLRQPPRGAPPDYRPSLATDKPSIAVLPFANFSDDPKLDDLGSAIMMDLTVDLSKLSNLVVVAIQSTLLYKERDIRVQEVSKELGVRYIVQGSVRTGGDHVLISAQLIDGLTGMQVWGERYERPLHDLFDIQEEVRRKILVHVGLKLTPQEEERLQSRYTRNLEAYNYMVRAAEALLSPLPTPQDVIQSRELCVKATTLDPTYAAAYALQGVSYWAEWLGGNSDPQLLNHAFTLAQKALALDDSFPGGHEVLAVVDLFRDRQYQQALAELKQALTLSPNWFSSYDFLAITLNALGRPEEVVALETEALKRSPQSHLFFLLILAEAYTKAQRYEEAITTYKRVLAGVPYHPIAYIGLAGVYTILGRGEEARTAAAAVLRIIPNFSAEEMVRKWPYTNQAETDRALALLRKAGLK